MCAEHGVPRSASAQALSASAFFIIFFSKYASELEFAQQGKGRTLPRIQAKFSVLSILRSQSRVALLTQAKARHWKLTRAALLNVTIWKRATGARWQ